MHIIERCRPGSGVRYADRLVRHPNLHKKDRLYVISRRCAAFSNIYGSKGSPEEPANMNETRHGRLQHLCGDMCWYILYLLGWQVPNTMYQREESERESGVVAKMHRTLHWTENSLSRGSKVSIE